jgi:beta-1,4-mannosyltransferase
MMGPDRGDDRPGARDSRIRTEIRFIDESEAATFFTAADLCVLAYRKIFNSGTAMLSLSFSTPVLVSASPSMSELQAVVGRDWLRIFSGPLTPALIEESVDHFRALPPGRVAPLEAFDWTAVSARTLEFFERLCARTA